MAGAAAARDGEYDLVMERVYPRIAPLFVQASSADHRPWDKNLAAWDALRADEVAAMSTVLLQRLSDALLSVASAKLNAIPPSGHYTDSTADGVDPARFALAERQTAALRAANAALHALDIALAVADEGRILAAAHVVYNGILPTLEGENPSIAVLRPALAILHALTTGLSARRWSDAPLQLLAARAIQAALTGASAAHEQSQAPIVAHITAAFILCWKSVMACPNARQQAHIRVASADLGFVKRVLKSLRIENPAEVAAAAAAAAPDPKGKGAKPTKAADKTPPPL
jgi:hypothetical protein